MAKINTRKDLSELSVKRNTDLEDKIQEVLEQVVEGKDTSKNSYQYSVNASDPLASLIKDRFAEVERNRKEIEDRWLKDLRQYRGQYDPDILSRIHPKRSKAYIRITRTKVKTVDSRLLDLLFPANGDKNWSINPTTIPDLDNKQLQQIVAEFIQQGAQNVTREMLELRIRDKAKELAKNMEKSIDDQLQDMRYRDNLREVIHSGNVYGTGILKGPMISLTRGRQYKQVQRGGKTSWELDNYDKLMPYIEHVPVWDFYPDMSSSYIADCRFVIQRHKMTKRQILDLADRSDFMGDKIRERIKTDSSGDAMYKDFETQLHNIGENLSSTFNKPQAGKKFEVLEYWGYVDADDLEKAGASIPEDIRGAIEVAANIWVFGDKVIKAAISHMGELQWPFFLYYYDKDETSIFGEGIPSIMRDVQDLTNSAFRAMLDNAAISAGPQIEVNMDLISEDEDPTDIYPFKVWLRNGSGLDAQSEAVRVNTLPSYTNEFLAMCQAFGKYANEVTVIPEYMWGEAQPGIARTSSGLSMLMGSANIALKDQVKNFDDGITKPFITSMYHWNMKFNSDDSVKGDFNIRAEGTASLIAKEVYSNALMQFATITNNPTYAPMVKHSSILRSIADSLDLGDKELVLSDEEMAANNQQQQQSDQKQREFMLQMTEIARQYGISPNDMIENLRMAYMDRESAMAG